MSSIQLYASAMSNSTFCNNLLAAAVLHKILDSVKSVITNSQLQIALSKHLALEDDICSSHSEMLSRHRIIFF